MANSVAVPPQASAAGFEAAHQYFVYVSIYVIHTQEKSTEQFRVPIVTSRHCKGSTALCSLFFVHSKRSAADQKPLRTKENSLPKGSETGLPLLYLSGCNSGAGWDLKASTATSTLCYLSG